MAVGAYQEDSNATGINGNQANNSASNSGAVYVFERTGTTWTQQAYIKASNTSNGDLFGYAQSISADGNHLVAGAPFEDSNATGIEGIQSNNSAPNSGAAYVFVRTGSVWSQQAYVKASNTNADDRFGNTVSISGDGITIAVGSPNEDSNATGIGGNQNDNSVGNSGAVYVFLNSGSWSQQSYMKASNSESDDTFGYALCLSADGKTLAVGTPSEDSNALGLDGDQSDNTASSAGAVYLRRKVGSIWLQEHYIKASNTETSDFFGWTLSLTADGNMLVVGSHQEDSIATGINGNQNDNSVSAAGSVYVIE